MTLNNYLCECMLINQGFLNVKCKLKSNLNLSLIQDWKKTQRQGKNMIYTKK